MNIKNNKCKVFCVYAHRIANAFEITRSRSQEETGEVISILAGYKVRSRKTTLPECSKGLQTDHELMGYGM